MPRLLGTASGEGGVVFGTGDVICLRIASGDWPILLPRDIAHLSLPECPRSPARREKFGDAPAPDWPPERFRAGEFEREPYGETSGEGVRKLRFWAWLTGKLRRRISGEFSRELSFKISIFGCQKVCCQPDIWT